MGAWIWLSIAVAIWLVLAAISLAGARARRRRVLQRTFGPEYDRVVEDASSRRDAEAELAERRARRSQLEIRDVRPTVRSRFADRWRQIQERFVDDPDAAILEADALIQEVMHDRGYPIEDFERRAADISVDHPHVVENYRAAHATSVARARGEATTEDARVALVHYRSLFEELLEQAAESAVRDSEPAA